MAGVKGRSGPPGNKNAMVHGLTVYRAMLNGDDLDKRTSLYRALAEKESELIVALGGDPTPQERIIIADTVKHILFAGSVDRYLLSLKSLVRKGKAHRVLADRGRIGAHIRENLKVLGINRRSKPMPSLDDYIRENYSNRDVDNADENAEINAQDDRTSTQDDGDDP
jgi:hypothetical protein